MHLRIGTSKKTAETDKKNFYRSPEGKALMRKSDQHSI